MKVFQITILLVALASSLAQAGWIMCYHLSCYALFFYPTDYWNEKHDEDGLVNSLKNAKPDDTIKQDESPTDETTSLPDQDTEGPEAVKFENVVSEEKEAAIAVRAGVLCIIVDTITYS